MKGPLSSAIEEPRLRSLKSHVPKLDEPGEPHNGTTLKVLPRDIDMTVENSQSDLLHGNFALCGGSWDFLHKELIVALF